MLYYREELSNRDRVFMPASTTAASLGAGKIAQLEAELKHARVSGDMTGAFFSFLLAIKY